MTFLISGASPTVRKLRDFQSLPDGWHYGSGKAIPQARVAQSIAMLDHMNMLGFTRTDAFAGASGEVLITAYHQTHYVAVTCEADDTWSMTHEMGREECCSAENEDDKEIKRLLLKVALEIWPTFGWFTQEASNHIAADSTILPSRQLSGVVCHSSTSDALRILAA